MMTTVLDQVQGENFTAIHGDCVEATRELPTESVGFSIFSPPFSHLFIYSDSERDMGNAASDAEFLEHYRFLVRELYRVTKPGRLCAVHCSELPKTKAMTGTVGLYDLPGELIRTHCTSVEADRLQAAIGEVVRKIGEYQDEENFAPIIHLEDVLKRLERERDTAAAADGSWVFHSRVTIWKDPVVEMTRTKALGLLHKQLLKDSTRSRVGMPDYLLVFRKTPGDEKAADRVGHDAKDFPVDLWQKWASPVWMDIDQTDVLNVRIAREDKDEKHLCPLQLDLIERAIRLWSNPGDVVLSPFLGVGSEGYGALKTGRKFVGVELKRAYFDQAVRNLAESASIGANDLFKASAA